MSSPCTRVVEFENLKTHRTTTATQKCRCDVAVLPQSAADAILKHVVSSERVLEMALESFYSRTETNPVRNSRLKSQNADCTLSRYAAVMGFDDVCDNHRRLGEELVIRRIRNRNWRHNAVQYCRRIKYDDQFTPDSMLQGVSSSRMPEFCTGNPGCWSIIRGPAEGLIQLGIAMHVAALGIITGNNLIPVEHLRALHSLYNLLEDILERTRMMTRWCEVVERDNLPILPVIDAAERCGDEDAMAEAYCIQIRRWEKKATVIEPRSFNADGLSQEHIQRILSGYASLSLSWSRLRGGDSSFPLANARFQFHVDLDDSEYSSPQAHEEACIEHSRSRWAQAVVEADRRFPHITQLVNRFRHAVQYLKESEPSHSYHYEVEDCLQNVIELLNLNIQNEVHLLANHFFPKSHVA
ncbi:hypothetical protein GGX14DRAFT_588330 [Mycena pura]|uniref:Uncharacterized protein n=1 Tax=Mycena pura TaxID=153505 RepID=A0AAD6Y0P3_9AGAR|nr:hypothetical protein GGX14DRAFT_588330 [Mycena pura]